MSDPLWMLGDDSAEQAAWETWAGRLRAGDRCGTDDEADALWVAETLRLDLMGAAA